MVSERDRILNLVEYIQSHGVNVNIGKNKARGNKGFFKVKGDVFRIDIAKGMDSSAVLRILVHEFAHYIHYCHDKTLKSLSFIMDDNDEILLAEMLDLTVESIPKNSVEPLFQLKQDFQRNIKHLTSIIKNTMPDFKPSEPNKFLESKIMRKPYKYLLKHDSVRVLKLFGQEEYSISDLEKYETNEEILCYLRLKYYQRNLKKISSKISGINKYYNSPTELFARSVEAFICDNDMMKNKAPNLFMLMEETIKNNNNSMLSKMVNICI